MPAVQRARGGSGDGRWEDSECRQGRWFFLVYGLYFPHKFLYRVHSIGRVSSVAAQDRARTGAARAGAETSDEDFHRTGSRFEPEGERARQAAGEDYGRPAESEYAAERESARTA